MYSQNPDGWLYVSQGFVIKYLYSMSPWLYSSQSCTYNTDGITCQRYSFHSIVRIPNLGALPIIASVSLTHLPRLFACFYESLSCVYALFSTCFSTCSARAAGFGFSSVSISTFLFSFTFSYKFNRHLCHSASSCTHTPANMPKLLFHLHLHFSKSCLCVCKHVYAFPSSIFIHIYHHLHMYCLCYVLYLYPCFCFLSSLSET